MDLQAELGRAIGFHKGNRFQEAEEIYQQILAAQSDYPKAKHLYGLLLYQTGKKIEGMNHIKGSIDVDPKDKSTYMDLLKMYKVERQMEDAIALMEIYNANFVDPKGLVELATLLKGASRYVESANALEKAIALAPEYPELYFNLSNTLRECGREEQAADVLRKLLVLKPEFTEARLNLCNLLVQMGLFDEVLGVTEEFLEKSNAPYELLRVGAQALIGLERTELALNVLKRALELKPRSEFCHENLAISYEKLKNYASALSHAQKCIEINPQNAYAMAIESTILSRHGRFDEALKRVELAFKLDEQNSYILSAFLDQIPVKHPAENELYVAALKALESISESETIRKSSLEFKLGQFLEKMGKYSDAHRLITRANARVRETLDYDVSKDMKYMIETLYQFENAKFPKDKKAEEYNNSPIFIVGMPRSGTSLLEQMLSRHPCIEARGELEHLREILNSRLLINTALIEQDYEFIGNEYLRLAGANAKSKYFTDKMPHNFLFLGHLMRAIPHAKVIWCHRKGVETCWSNYKNLFAHAGSHQYTYSIPEIAEYYKAYLKLHEFWKQKLGSSMQVVSYEELVKNPKNQLSKVFDYLELDFEENCLNYTEGEQRVAHTLSALQVQKPIYKDSLNLTNLYGPELNELRNLLS